MDKKKLDEMFASLETKYKSKADAPVQSQMSYDDMCQIMNSMYNDMYQMVSSVRNYMYSIEDQSYAKWQSHGKGHLPNARTPSQMQKVLKVLGMDQDYDVVRPTITATRTNAGLKFEVDLNLPKSKE